MRGFWTAALAALLLVSGAEAQEASRFTREANVAALEALPLGDREDEDFAQRGFLAPPHVERVTTADGRVAWDFRAYDFLQGAAPGSVHPSLWRHAQLLARSGVFEVTPRIYQVRGFDVSNMTVIVGDTGLIIVDPLTTMEVAAAALELARRNVEAIGQKPVRAVIYTHSHADHFGGARGVIPDGARVRVIAPEGFLEHAVSENIIAGPAMSRRAQYQFGSAIAPGVAGSMGSGIGLGVSGGTQTLVPPNESVTHTGQAMNIDGVRFVFQLTPHTEAPAEMHFYLPDFRVLDLAENANVAMHNVLTPRGALVRDSKAWADYLTEALRLYGAQSDIMITSHGWPRFGNDRVVDFIASHRDAYKYLHDQTVRLMNAGFTGGEIAERVRLPEALSQRWFNRGYYGTMMHNSRAVYQRYMGWYDGVPAHLYPLAPEEAARNYVRVMGGARGVLREGRRALGAGEYRWAAEVLDRLVFAEPENAEARGLLADAYAQLGYQAESAIWRNLYLMGAEELRNGVRGRPAAGQAGDLVANTPTSAFFDLLAVRLNPEAAANADLRINFIFPERNERVAVTVRNSVLVHEMGVSLADAQASVTLPRPVMLSWFAGARADYGMVNVQFEGDRAAVAALAGLFGQPDPNFAIVTP